MLARALLASGILASPALAGITSLDLSNYELSTTFTLPAIAAAEASAVTYDWDTGNLFVLGDEGDALVEVTRTGTVVSTMTLTGFDDTEGLTYIGGGQLVLTEERLQDAYRLTYAASGTVDRGALPTASLGDTVGNVGIEGISFDPRDGSFVLVKEKTPQQARRATIDFTNSSATITDLFTPNLGLLDLSDVAVLSTVPSLTGTPDADNLLIFSQESARLLEVTRAGAVLSEFNLTGVTDAEGVTIDPDGVIYIAGETPLIYVLTPVVPEPTVGLLLGAAALLVRRHRH